MKKSHFFSIVVAAWFGSAYASFIQQWIWHSAWKDVGNAFVGSTGACLGIALAGWITMRVNKS